MTPVDKANELYEKYYSELYPLHSLRPRIAKQCALVAVNELLLATQKEKQVQYDNGEWSRSIQIIEDQFWVEVKEQIKNL